MALEHMVQSKSRDVPVCAGAQAEKLQGLHRKGKKTGYLDCHYDRYPRCTLLGKSLFYLLIKEKKILGAVSWGLHIKFLKNSKMA